MFNYKKIVQPNHSVKVKSEVISKSSPIGQFSKTPISIKNKNRENSGGKMLCDLVKIEPSFIRLYGTNFQSLVSGIKKTYKCVSPKSGICIMLVKINDDVIGRSCD